MSGRLGELITVTEAEARRLRSLADDHFNNCIRLAKLNVTLTFRATAAEARISDLEDEVIRLREAVWRAYWEGFSDGPGDPDECRACYEISDAHAALERPQS